MLVTYSNLNALFADFFTDKLLYGLNQEKENLALVLCIITNRFQLEKRFESLKFERQ